MEDRAALTVPGSWTTGQFGTRSWSAEGEPFRQAEAVPIPVDRALNLRQLPEAATSRFARLVPEIAGREAHVPQMPVKDARLVRSSLATAGTAIARFVPRDGTRDGGGR